jgi:hypothetical protein
MLKYFAFVILLLTIVVDVFADSPLTSTYFYKAYSEETYIKEALILNHEANDKVLTFLSDDNTKLEFKLAIINALGWQSKGNQNSSQFLSFLIKIGKYKSESDLINSSNQNDLICYAYLKAMDNYFNVSVALEIAQNAEKLDNKSKAIHVIYVLIKAQNVLNESKYSFNKTFCKVYKSAKTINNLSSLNNDFSEAALEFILPYINSYKRYCFCILN